MPVGGFGGQLGSIYRWREQASPVGPIPDKLCYTRGKPALPAGYYAITPVSNMLVGHKGDGEFRIQKYDGAAAYDAQATGPGISGSFILHMRRVTTVGTGWYGGGMNSLLAGPTIGGSPGNPFYGFYYSVDFNSWFIFENTVQITGSVIAGTDAWIWRDSGNTLRYGRGVDFATAQANVERTTAGATGTLYLDTVANGMGFEFDATLYDMPATTAYSLTADVGIFTITAQNALLETGYNMPVVQATYTINGQPANTIASLLMPAGLATYTINGQAALSTRGYLMAAAVGTYTYTGQSANTIAALLMAAGLGTYSYSGQAAILERGYSMPAVVGTFTYSGQPASLERGSNMQAGLATFTINGQPANTIASLLMPAAVGIYSYTGQPANLTRALPMPAAVGVYSYSGQPAQLPLGRTITATVGVFTINGQAATLTPFFAPVSYPMTASVGVYTINGQPARFTLSGSVLPPIGSGSGPRVTASFYGF